VGLIIKEWLGYALRVFEARGVLGRKAVLRTKKGSLWIHIDFFSNALFFFSWTSESDIFPLLFLYLIHFNYPLLQVISEVVYTTVVLHTILW
jgi:hypothetical protein